MSEKSKRMSKGKEVFRFVPFSCASIQEKYKHFHSSRTNIFVASEAASKRKKAKLHSEDSTLSDLYVLVEIIEDECNGDEWHARVVELIGECTDLFSCAQILAHNRSLMDGNQKLDAKHQAAAQTAKNISSSTSAKPFDLSCLAASLSEGCTYPDRRDLRSADGNKDGLYNIFSVDPPGCLDIDDAVHIRIYNADERTSLQPLLAQKMPGVDANAVFLCEVGVHIADVTNYVKQFCTDPSLPPADSSATPSSGSSGRLQRIVSEALHRSFTVYLPGQQIPILPTYLSHEECSLQAGEDRFTLSCMLTLACSTAPPPAGTAVSSTPEGDCPEKDLPDTKLKEVPPSVDNFKVLSYKFEKTLIRSVGAFTYDQVDQFLDNHASNVAASATDTSAASTAKITVAPAKCASTAPAKCTSAKGAANKSAQKPVSREAPPRALPSCVKLALKNFRKLFPTRDSHKLVEQLMLLANMCAAEFLDTRSLQAVSGGGADSTGTPISVGAGADVSASAYAYLLRRQLPISFIATTTSAEVAGTDGNTSDNVTAAAPKQQFKVDFSGVPVDLTANAAEYIYCPAITTTATAAITATTNATDTAGTAIIKVSAEGVADGSADANADTDVNTVSQAPLTAVEKAHVSLGVKLYTHFTSPIRRYADQIVHALISQLLEEEQCHRRRCEDPADPTGSAARNSAHSTAGYAADPWLSNFSPATVAYVNLKQKQHKRFQRDMSIVDFVFSQCEAAGANEVTLSAEAVVLPFRFSEKYSAYKTDLYVLSPCEFVYPLRIHTLAQAQLFDISYTDTTLTLRSRQTKEEKVLEVGDRIAVQVHCCKSAPAMRKKCVISSASITF